MTDDRLEGILYAFEVSYLVVFVEEITKKKYDKLVEDILMLRNLSDNNIANKFHSDEHTLVNSAYEWDYYVSELFVSAGIFIKTEGDMICQIQHGNTKTYRKITRNYVKLTGDIVPYCKKLLQEYPYDASPLNLEDNERLKIDIIKEIYLFTRHYYWNILEKRTTKRKKNY